MATPQEIVELRLEVQEPNNVEPYTDDLLSSLIDSYGVTEAAHKIWIQKRNAVADLVDITEGGSSRKMSQLYENYNKIVGRYEVDDTSGRRAPRTREITR